MLRRNRRGVADKTPDISSGDEKQVLKKKEIMFDKLVKEKKGKDFFDAYRNFGDGTFLLIEGKYFICSGFCDLHVHFREPGFFYKESIKSGSLAGARGGYTTVCTMPNLNPAPDTLENLNVQREIIKKDAVIEVIPYGTITKGEKGDELSDMRSLAPYVCAFSDDGRGVQSDDMMRLAMEKAKSLDKIISAHCEDNSLLKGGCIHDGEWAKRHGFIGISSESEYKQLERDLRLAKEIGVRYHVCHISTKESVELIRNAKKEGVSVTCETAPHYLVLTENDLRDEGRFKMNPPVRSEEDKRALIEGVIDGTIDAIATDHAPHSKEEKSKGLKDSAFGIVGLETAFPLLYTRLVKENVITLQRLVELMSDNPRKIFDIKKRNNDYTVFEIANPYKISPEDFLSKGRSTPFEGDEVFGRCVLTVKDDKTVYSCL